MTKRSTETEKEGEENVQSVRAAVYSTGSATNRERTTGPRTIAYSDVLGFPQRVYFSFVCL